MSNAAHKLDDDDDGGWHEDFPEAAREMWDIVAKVLMTRIGGGILTITREEMLIAARSPAMMRLDPVTGDLEFYLKNAGQPQN